MSRCYSQPWNYYSYASIALLKRMSSWMSRLIFNAAFKYLWGIFIALLNWRRSGTNFERTNATRSPSIPFVLPHVSCGWDERRFERVDDFVGEEKERKNPVKERNDATIPTRYNFYRGEKPRVYVSLLCYTHDGRRTTEVSASQFILLTSIFLEFLVTRI